jgi:tetratricopeptide (TPR) repeat protein/tRNA A-37 threonylcarbamoyl transferase component Bud32
MSSWNAQANELFLKALEMRSAGQRQEYLDGACAADAALRAEVEALLEASARAGRFLESPAPALNPVATADEPITDRPGDIIGPYKLMEQIGEGGMGLVYVAEQQQPVRRKVAVKVIKPGMDSRQVIARFEAERQALAMMEHANIAKVHDGGTTPEGRPYFVMELVKGTPITAYCDQNQVPVRERLQLFIDVCQAVQHAHQKGIIHRDIKPSNVLVTSHDGKPVVKVIDFGVAKAIGQQLTEKTVYTQIAQLIGTPLYMSPEQAGESGLDIDTRSDIYSLGVLLYELLTGTTPFDKERLSQVGYDEMRRIIREEEPPKPSTRVSTLGQAATTASTQRQSDLKQLGRMLRGELDWIVMKALEKDRDRRYETASAFAADVQRYLADEPVRACPPSAWYRFRKFARRNKAGLAIAGLILFFIVLLGGSIGWFLGERAMARTKTDEEAHAALRQAIELHQQGRLPEALLAARQAQVVLERGHGSPDLLRQVEEVRADLNMVARLEDTWLQGAGEKWNPSDFDRLAADYARAFRGYGIDVDTLDGEEAAERIRARSIRADLAAGLDHWAALLKEPRKKGLKTRKDLLAVARAADPDPYRQRVRAAWQSGNTKELLAIAASEDLPDLPAASLVSLASSLESNGAIEAAVAVLRKAQWKHPNNFYVHLTLGDALHLSLKPPKLVEAIGSYSAARALRPQSLAANNNLGAALWSAARIDEAVAALREAIHIQPDLAYPHFNLGQALRVKGRLDEAIVEYREATRLDPNHLGAHQSLARLLVDLGKFAEAETEYRLLIGLKPNEHQYHRGLGAALKNQGNLAGAEVEYREAIRLEPKDYAARTNLGMLLTNQGKFQQAEEQFRQAIKFKADYANAHRELAYLLDKQNKLSEAVTESRTAIRINPKDHLAYSNLGNYLRKLSNFAEAEAALRTAIKLKPDVSAAHFNLGLVFHQQRKFVEAEAEYRKTLDLDPKDAEAHCNLGLVLMDQRKFAAALPELRRGHELGSARPGWPHPSDQWVRKCEALAAQENK